MPSGLSCLYSHVTGGGSEPSCQGLPYRGPQETQEDWFNVKTHTHRGKPNIYNNAFQSLSEELGFIKAVVLRATL